MGLTHKQAVARLVVALDTSERGEILDLAGRLRHTVGMLKVGLEAFTACGPALVEALRAAGMPVFLDLKLHDIPNTVERAARNVSRLGVSLMTVHAGGGEAMLQAAASGAAAGAVTWPYPSLVTMINTGDAGCRCQPSHRAQAPPGSWPWRTPAHRGHLPAWGPRQSTARLCRPAAGWWEHP